MLFDDDDDDDDDDDLATTNSFHEASHPINVNVKEMHVTD